MVAAIFKNKPINAKIILPDLNPGIRIKTEGFNRAFAEFYSDSIHYEASTEIKGVIQTTNDQVTMDRIGVYSPLSKGWTGLEACIEICFTNE